MINVFDAEVLDSAADMYRAWTIPELYPDQRQPVLANWSNDDLAAYCGGQYTN